MQAPALVNTTGSPLAPPVAATVNWLPKFANGGGGVVNVIVCACAKFAVTDCGEFITIERGLVVEVTEPVKFTKEKPAFGVAVTTALEAALKYPPALTVPPVPADVVSRY